MAKKKKGGHHMKGGHSHTGHARHHDMESLHVGQGHGGRDSLADPMHHSMNKEAGMEDGMSPTNFHCYGDGEAGGEGGEGMAGNAHCE